MSSFISFLYNTPFLYFLSPWRALVIYSPWRTFENFSLFLFSFSSLFIFQFFLFPFSYFPFLEKLAMYSLPDVYFSLLFRNFWQYSFLDELGALTYKLFINFFYRNFRLNFKLLMILIRGIWKRNFVLAQTGCKGSVKVFRMKKHGHISLRIMIA